MKDVIKFDRLRILVLIQVPETSGAQPQVIPDSMLGIVLGEEKADMLRLTNWQRRALLARVDLGIILTE